MCKTLLTTTLAMLLTTVTAHSWLECTDYRVTPNSDATKVWDKSLCFGHARCGKRQADQGFGVDTGFNYHSGTGCQCNRDQDNYAGVTKAVYTPGQRVCLAYPSKNHVAAACTNDFIPDTGVIIKRSAAGATVDDDAVSRTYTHGNGDHQTGQADYKGFQNCPNFCSNMDKSLCTMCFDLEADLAPGEYTFRWVWAFNSKDDVYSSCWEAEVRANGQAGNGQNDAGKVHAPTDETTTSPTMKPTPTTATPASTSSTPNATTATPSATTASPSPTTEASANEDDELDCDSNDHKGHEHHKQGYHQGKGHEGNATQYETRGAAPETPVSTTTAPPMPTTTAPPATITPPPTTASPSTVKRCGVVKN